MNIRVIPPAGGATTVVNGRSYTAASNAVLDVPDFDGWILIHNGWTQAAAGVGVTASRPSNPAKNQTFHDTTLGYNIVFDGKVWRNPSTGAAV